MPIRSGTKTPSFLSERQGSPNGSERHFSPLACGHLPVPTTTPLISSLPRSLMNGTRYEGAAYREILLPQVWASRWHTADRNSQHGSSEKPLRAQIVRSSSC